MMTFAEKIQTQNRHLRNVARAYSWVIFALLGVIAIMWLHFVWGIDLMRTDCAVNCL